MQQLTCLNCPFRCKIDVEYDEDSIFAIEGNNCERGFRFVLDSLNLPKRNLSVYVKVENSSVQKIKVTTSHPINRDLIPDLEDMLGKITLQAPVKPGDLVLANVLDSGVDIISTEQAL